MVKGVTCRTFFFFLPDLWPVKTVKWSGNDIFDDIRKHLIMCGNIIADHWNMQKW